MTAKPAAGRPLACLVTGGAGFIGSTAVRRLLAWPDGKARRQDVRVAVVDALRYCANPLSLQELEADPRFAFYQADVADEASLRAIFREVQPDRVLHLAAESHVDRSIDGPRAFLHANVEGTFALLETARAYWDSLDAERRASFRLLHVSTDEVYGDLARDAAPAAEGAPYCPSSPYSATKAAADHLVRAWTRTFNLPCMVSSSTNNYGPRQFPEKLIPLCILRALEGKTLPIYGDGLQVRDWIHVDDHARALALILERGRPGESYHVAGQAPSANIDLVRRLCRLLDELAPERRPQGLDSFAELIVHVADRPGHDLRYALDASKLRRELGWKPEISLDQGLAATVEWYLANEAWWRPVLDGGRRLERLGRPGRLNHPDSLNRPGCLNPLGSLNSPVRLKSPDRPDGPEIPDRSGHPDHPESLDSLARHGQQSCHDDPDQPDGPDQPIGPGPSGSTACSSCKSGISPTDDTAQRSHA